MTTENLSPADAGTSGRAKKEVGATNTLLDATPNQAKQESKQKLPKWVKLAEAFGGDVEIIRLGRGGVK
jgi:hypothetical protein